MSIGPTNFRDLLVGVAFDQGDDLIDSGPLEVLSGQGGPLGVDFVSGQVAARGP